MHHVTESSGPNAGGKRRNGSCGSLVGRGCAASDGGRVAGRCVVGGGLLGTGAGSLSVYASGRPGKAADWYIRVLGRGLTQWLRLWWSVGRGCLCIGFVHVEAAWQLFRGGSVAF